MTRHHFILPAPAILPHRSAPPCSAPSGANSTLASLLSLSSLPSKTLTTLGLESVLGRDRSSSAGIGKRDTSPEVCRMESNCDEMATEWTGASVGEAYRYDSLLVSCRPTIEYCDTVRSSSDMTRKQLADEVLGKGRMEVTEDVETGRDTDEDEIVLVLKSKRIVITDIEAIKTCSISEEEVGRSVIAVGDGVFAGKGKLWAVDADRGSYTKMAVEVVKSTARSSDQAEVMASSRSSLYITSPLVGE